MKKSELVRACEHLIFYALDHELITESDVESSIKCLSSRLKIEPFVYDETIFEKTFFNDLNTLLDHAVKHQLIPNNHLDERDAFEAFLFDCVMPTPDQVKEIFHEKFNQTHSDATNYLYKLSKDVNYIKTERLKQNYKWTYDSKYGRLNLTINLAKPEKDPKEIAEAKDLTQKSNSLMIPKCVICKENEQNYYNARMNLRMVPLELGGETWHLQYSPYLYYTEHAIILHDVHRPMKTSRKTFEYLLDFMDMFPFYFIGSNADLPIVGGSILNHDHFQGGRQQFPIQNAKVIKDFGRVNHVEISHLHWPLSTIRLTSDDKEELIRLAEQIFNTWKTYDHLDLDIISQTDGVPHNTITPIARKTGNYYELDLILRNNRTTSQYPYGIFHPKPDVFHIKKENIGLIEAMGLAILPGRLKQELKMILEWLKKPGPVPAVLEKHAHWMMELKKMRTIQYTEAFLYKEVGKKFERVIEDAGVFKLNDSGIKAMHQLIYDIINLCTA